MLRHLLYLQPGDLRRLLPFFGFYLLLFAMMNVADGLSLSLFVHRVGSAQLPFYYGLTAVVNLVLLWLYMRSVDKLTNMTLFKIILGGSLLVFLLAWLVIQYADGGSGWYGSLFVSREITFTLVIMHFGTFLQDYFTRGELNRILPTIYAGGRVGGILGGVLVALGAAWVGTVNLVLVYIVLGCICLLFLKQMEAFPLVDEEEGELPIVKEPGEPEERGQGFWHFLRSSPLMFWLSVTSILFILCRWILNYEYNHYFETHFTSDEAMAEFLGWYTSLALVVSLLVQVLLINRMVAYIGLKGAHFVFALLMMGGMGLNLMPMSLTIAVFSRLMETEFRVGFRNPIHMLMTNLFPKVQRTRARAWILGGITPLSTLLIAFILQAFQQLAWHAWIPALGMTVAVIYFVASFGLYTSFKEDALLFSKKREEPIPVQVQEGASPLD